MNQKVATLAKHGVAVKECLCTKRVHRNIIRAVVVGHLFHAAVLADHLFDPFAAADAAVALLIVAEHITERETEEIVKRLLKDVGRTE